MKNEEFKSIYDWNETKRKVLRRVMVKYHNMQREEDYVQVVKALEAYHHAGRLLRKAISNMSGNEEK